MDLVACGGGWWIDGILTWMQYKIWSGFYKNVYNVTFSMNGPQNQTQTKYNMLIIIALHLTGTKMRLDNVA